MTRTLAVLLALATTTAALASQSPAELLNRAVDAMRNTDALRCNLIASDHEDLRSSRMVARASLVATLNKDEGVTAARLDAKLSGDDVPRGARAVLTAGPDGTQFLNYSNKTETLVPFDEMEQDPEIAAVLPMVQWIELFVLPGEDRAFLDDSSTRHLGVERLGRDECDVIGADLENGSLKIYLSRASGLPARIDARSPDGTTQVIRFTNLRTNVRAPEATFRIKPTPRGFRTSSDSLNGSPSKGDSKSSGSRMSGKTGANVGDMAPTWTLDTPDGSTKSLADYRGEYVLMDFWATWCGPCRRAMPGMQRLHNLYGPRGLNVIGVNTSEENPDEAVGYMRSKRFSYQLLLRADDVARQYNVSGIPSFFLINPQGQIVYASSGFSTAGEQKLEAKIRAELGLGPLLVDPEDVDEEDLEDFEDY